MRRLARAALLLLLANVSAIELRWTQYSDRASLPQSKYAREELRANLNRIDSSRLAPAEKMQLRNLKRLLDSVIAESEVELPAAEGVMGVLRLAAPEALRPHLQWDRLALTAVLLVLAGTLVSGFCANLADDKATRASESMMEAERKKHARKNGTAKPVQAGEAFPEDVAEALCFRVASSLATRKGQKLSSKHKPTMDTNETAMQLARYHALPEAEVADKALRRDRKKLRLATQAAEKAMEEAREALAAVSDKVAAAQKRLKKAEDALAAATKKERGKRQSDAAEAAQALELAQRELVPKENALAQRALAAEAAAKAEERPALLVAMEGTWLHTVSQAWCDAARRLDGWPTPSHVNAWARSGPLRKASEELYRAAVSEKAFLS